MTCNRVTIHHEGAGSPTDNVSRFLDTDDYSAGIGKTLYELRRSPADSFHTTGQGDVDCVQICLSGHRGQHPVTDNDLDLVAQVCEDARARGWLGETPELYLHGDTASTDCPGQYTRNRRDDLERAILGQPPAIPGGDDDMPTGAQQMVSTPSGSGYWIVGSDGGVFCFGDAGFYGSTGDIDVNAPIVGLTPTPSGAGYWLLGQDGGVFSFGDAQFYGAPTGKIR